MNKSIKALTEFCSDLIDVLEAFQAEDILEYREILTKYAKQCEGIEDE